ncbi:DUF2812 domain-containing protein [Neobacillus sp. PS2-9]|uniref:DUF2812 domain-containing protein n=1 Tax=Neobacillus sp. PS2-9 TaxID=3070676 RepID=UPI0027DEE2CA|nr:DUF2812 domain-containing protein [Neobacillus sp. PS2-9]WML57745.1 DUF2812 domain-containing protein [Neobacillus sp. PS2-9]
MRKFKFFLDFEKEEKWLNDMATEGYELVGRSMGYRFRSVRPEKVNIKIDYRTFKKQTDFADYEALFEDCGWKHLAGTKSSGVQYFKMVREDASEDIFSDGDSKAGRYKRFSELYLSLATLYLPIFTVLIATDSIDIDSLFNPKLLYYTPGLWGKTGAAFWEAFLFETPFAFMRGISWSILPVMISIFLIFSIRANWHYHKVKK